MNTKLWQPIHVGNIKLAHRLAMAPMIRSRSTAQGVPTELNAGCYAQRASMALIISEGTQPSDALVLNRGGADLPARIADIDNGTAGVIAVGSMSLANPDLVERIRTKAPLNAPDRSTFYDGGTKGYRDYPTLAMTAPQ